MLHMAVQARSYPTRLEIKGALKDEEAVSHLMAWGSVREEKSEFKESVCRHISA